MNEDEFAINERKIDKLGVGESRKLDLRVKNYIAYQLTRIADTLQKIEGRPDMEAALAYRAQYPADAIGKDTTP